MELEKDNKLKLLDVKIYKISREHHLSINWKPLKADKIIHNTSSHPYIHKLAVYKQKESPKNMCTDTLDGLKSGPNSLERVLICDESWFFTHDPEAESILTES